MCREMLKSLQDIYAEQFPTQPKPIAQASILLQGVQSREYQPLMSRKMCETLENRIEHYAKKRRIQVSVKEVGEEGGNKED